MYETPQPRQPLKGFRTFKPCFCWWMYNSYCTIRTTEVLTLCKTLCSFMTDCCELLCWHQFTLHGAQSITNRKWQWRSPGACANWPVDLNKLDHLILHLSLLYRDETFCVIQMGNLGLFRKDWFWKFGIPLSLSWMNYFEYAEVGYASSL